MANLPELTAKVEMYAANAKRSKYNIIFCLKMGTVEVTMKFRQQFFCLSQDNLGKSKLNKWVDLAEQCGVGGVSGVEGSVGREGGDYIENFSVHCFDKGNTTDGDTIEFSKGFVTFWVGSEKLIQKASFRYPRYLCGPVFQSVANAIEK